MEDTDNHLTVEIPVEQRDIDEIEKCLEKGLSIYVEEFQDDLVNTWDDEGIILVDQIGLTSHIAT